RDINGIPTGSMGVDAADYSGTGLAALFVTNYEGESHSLYRNKRTDGQLLFHYSTQTAGIAAIGQNFVGFGTAFLDVDGDGWEDLRRRRLACSGGRGGLDPRRRARVLRGPRRARGCGPRARRARRLRDCRGRG